MPALRRFFVLLISALALVTVVTPAATASTATPWTIPALKQWTSAAGSFTFTARSRVVAATPAELATAWTFASDLTELVGRPVAVAVGQPRPHDLALRLDRTVNPAAEGYTLAIGASVVISGATDTGVFWGTRSILQMLHQNLTLPAGNAHDWPDYGYRGISLCNCVTFMSVPWLERLIKDMSYLKYNELHVEMRVYSTAHPENNSTTNPIYTPQQVAEITAFGQRYHVDVVQQISSPSHSSYYLAAHPNLVVTDAAGTPETDDVNMADPAALPYFESIDREQLAEFPGDLWYGGGDEYLSAATDYENYPSLVNWVHQQAGATAPAADAWILWQNEMDDYVTGQHRTLHVWNDQFYANMPTKLNPNIDIDYWIQQSGRMTPAEIVANGNNIVNVSDSLYYVNTPPSAQWIYETFTPNLFSGNQTVPADDPHLLGAAMGIWPSAHGLTEASYEQGMYAPLRALAQKNWGGTPLVSGYADFEPIIAAIGHAPGYDQPGPLAPNHVYRLNGTNWLVTEDTAGLYTLTSTADGRCLAVTDDSYNQNAPIATADCDATKSDQNWLLEPAGNRFVLRSDSSGRVLTQAGSALIQQYGPVSANQYWTITTASDQLAAHATTSANVVPAGSTTTDTTTLTNWGTTAAGPITATLQPPTGDTATPTTPTTITTLAPGASARISWTVTIPGTAPTAYADLHTTLSGNLGATTSVMTTAAALHNATAYVANFTDNTVTPVNLGTQTPAATIPTGTLPGTITSAGHTSYVANQGGNSVSVIDATTNQVTATIPVGATPAGLALSPDDKTLWVTDYSDNAIQPINLATDTAGAEIPVGQGPEDVTVSPDGTTVWVACRTSNQVYAVTVATGATTALSISGGPDGIAITPNGATVYVAQENSTTVTPITTATDTVGAAITVGASPFNIAVSPDGTTLGVPINGGYTMAFVNTATNTVRQQITVGNAPAAVAFTSDSSLAYATVTGNNTVVPILLATGQVGPAFPVGGYPIGVTVVGG